MQDPRELQPWPRRPLGRTLATSIGLQLDFVQLEGVAGRGRAPTLQFACRGQPQPYLATPWVGGGGVGLMLSPTALTCIRRKPPAGSLPQPSLTEYTCVQTHTQENSMENVILMMGDRSWAQMPVVPSAQSCLRPHRVTDTSRKLFLSDSRQRGAGGGGAAWPSIFCCELSQAFH